LRVILSSKALTRFRFTAVKCDVAIRLAFKALCTFRVWAGALSEVEGEVANKATLMIQSTICPIASPIMREAFVLPGVGPS
jgi:hypothetical protein